MKFVIATHNQGKVVEFKRMLEPMGIEVVTAHLSEPEETGKTFMENAFIKAEAACKETGLPAVADDSGLCVDYLDGAPGIYSARFAQPGKRRLTVLEKLQGVPVEQRGAHFVSAVCCVFPNGDKIEAEGKCFGTIAFDSRWENGFGYDSIFEQEGRTFGEMTDEEKDEYNAGAETDGVDDSPQSAIAEAEEGSRDLADGCRDHSGSIFEHIDTVSAARDFDMVRAVIGQDKLNLLGYSYGTFLGTTYAGLFPENVGRFVLDGALDPSISIEDVSAMQMRGLDASLQQWIADCATQSTCPMGRTKDEGISNVRAFLESLDKAPLPTSDPDRPLTESLAITAMIGAMYNTQWWPQLSDAYADAVRRGDGSALLEIADLMNSRNPDGTYADNSTDAINAINNLDYEPEGTTDQWIERADALKSELPILGRYVGYPSAGLSAWPTEHADRQPIHATGAAPILVIGTTHDPATPYPMAQSLAEQLDSGVLITVEGWNHTAYRRGADQCVVRAVEDYLVKGNAPQNGLTCQ